MKSLSQPLAVHLFALVLVSSYDTQASTLPATNGQNESANAGLSHFPNRFEANYNIDTPGTISLNGDFRWFSIRPAASPEFSSMAIHLQTAVPRTTTLSRF